MSSISSLEHLRGDDGFIRLKGTFGVCGVKNNNNRVYETSNYKKMVEGLKARIASEGCPGELEHPSTMNINYNNVSHVVEDIDIDDKGVVTGTIKLLDTPKGKIAQALVEGGLPLFISSRAVGDIDKGKVTLSEIATYDLVGTPGFSQAKLSAVHEGRVCESLGDDMFYIIDEEKNNTDKDNMTNEELVSLVREMSSKVSSLENKITQQDLLISELNAELSIQAKSISESRQSINVDALANGIQNWIIHEVAPVIESWVKDEYGARLKETITESMKNYITNGYSTGVQGWIVEQLMPVVQEWIINEYGQGIQDWIVNEYGQGVQDWIVEQLMSVVQNWIVNEYSPVIESWMSDEFIPRVNESIREEKRDNKVEKLATVDKLLEMLDQAPAKPIVSRTSKMTESLDPRYIQLMPESMRPIWNTLTESQKDYIQRKARIYNLSTDEHIEKFWESVDIKAISAMKPQASITEGLNARMDSYEQNLRLQLRKHRQ